LIFLLKRRFGLNAQRSGQRSRKWIAPFFTVWTGQAFSLLGSQLVQFALIWWLTKITGSATVLALASLVGLLPQVFLGPVAGALVDRWNRRLVMIFADLITALATLGLAFLFYAGLSQVWHVYLILFIRAAAGSFQWPAMAASTSLMVPKEHLSRIQGANQTMEGVLSIGSAPLGALLLGILPMQAVLAVDVSTAVLAIGPLLFIPIPQPIRHDTPAGAPGGLSALWVDIRAGLQYVRGWPGLFILLIMATLINLVLNPAFALLPILVTKHFGGQAIQLAWIESALGIGMVIGGLGLSAWGGFRRRILTSLTGLVGLGIGVAGIGLAPASAFNLALFAMLFAGIMGPIVNGPIHAVVQAAVDPQMQGRVFTLIGSMAAAMSPLGMLIAGPVADFAGVRTWFIAGGLVTALMGIVGFFLPVIIHVEDGRGLEEGQEVSSQVLANNPGFD
jgi:DHA3 family macrolide efflux protein-like MFS transporter